MFSVCCPRHRQRVLLGPSEITSLSPAPSGGFIIGYRCFCGYEGRSALDGHCEDENCEERWDNRMAG